MLTLEQLRTEDPLINQRFLEDLFSLIKAVGYEPNEIDDVLLAYQVDRAVESLLNKINDLYLPPGLRQYLLRLIMAEFYTMKMATQTLPEDFNFEAGIKSLREDDVTIEFQDDRYADQASFLRLLDGIRNEEVDWLCYRKIKW